MSFPGIKTKTNLLSHRLNLLILRPRLCRELAQVGMQAAQKHPQGLLSQIHMALDSIGALTLRPQLVSHKPKDGLQQIQTLSACLTMVVCGDLARTQICFFAS